MHKHIPELLELHRQGRVSRRDFIRMSSLLGLSVVGAQAMLAGCGSPAPAPAAATAAPAAATAIPAAVATAVPAAAGAIKRGGELRVVYPVQKIVDPAAASWYEFNIFRNVAEYLTVTDQDNVTKPWLLEKWEPSDDLLTWTFNLRKGIKFNHGPELTTDDVIFNVKRWLDPNTGSSMTGLMEGYLSANDVEKVDDYTFIFHLKKPQIAVPEHLFNNPGVILPKDFEGDWVKQPYGTGPFTLEEYVVDERCVLKRREGYWMNGEDGLPLPYLDAIRFIYLGTDAAPAIAALSSAEIDLTQIQAPVLDALEGNQDILVATQVSSFTHVMRMRADVEPFSDVRVRKACKLVQEREQTRQATLRDYGAVGDDFHVAPIHPEYEPMDVTPRDVEKAKALLAEAGYADGLNIKLSFPNVEPCPTMAQLYKEAAAPAGINVELDQMPDAMYWDQWMDVAFGITSWTHRPLATMVLSLAYRTGAAWNESHWENAEFDALLDEAEMTYDIEKRREIMGKIQNLMREEGTVCIPRWAAFLWAHNKRVKGFRGAPSDHLFFFDTWLDQA